MKKVRTAVIPVAGLGTRFLPATKTVPKEMLPLLDRPCIDYIVTEAADAGIERIIFVTARGKDAMIDYFDSSPALEAHLRKHQKFELLEKVLEAGRRVDVISIRQRQALGLGHAVHTAKPIVGNEPFAVLLGDDIIHAKNPVIGEMIKVFNAHNKAVVGLMEVPNDQTQKYGICAGTWIQDASAQASSPSSKNSKSPASAKSRPQSQIMQVSTMVEKPHPKLAPSNYAIVGRYVLPAEIFELIEDTPPGAGGEIQLTDALHMLAKNNNVLGFRFEGERYDTGNALGLLRASLMEASRRDSLKSELQALITEMHNLFIK